ncbi:MAG: thioredoxin domain-containing protein [Phycisphaerales bacterium]
MSGAGEPNALAGELSPYLLQHAHNPVRWMPWGEEAIAQARARDVPLFVSVGYSTCYWCHVMERESFESLVAAAELNRGFVPVKVDREERPDVDELLMTACQVFTQLTEGRPSGGWPLHCFLDPQTLEPFYCGTYFPPEPAFGRPSFLQLLRAVNGAWASDRAGMREQASKLAEIVRRQQEGESGADAGATDARAALARLADPQLQEQVQGALLRLHDPTHGGFGGAPKFPTPAYLRYLFALSEGQPPIEAVVRRSLDAMALGGIFDQVGGGFHRYAVDATWTVPHFEKMLYDNGQLAALYAQAARRWDDAFYAQVARRTCEYALREMTGPQGEFFSAQDAEVDAREGLNYLWTPQQAREALAQAGCAELAPVAAALYGLDHPPNFQDPHHSSEPPRHVLRLEARPAAIALQLGMEPGALESARARIDAALLRARDARPQPRRDDKTLASWNGLMAIGMAETGHALGERRFVDAAARAVGFVLETLRMPDGALRRACRQGRLGGPGFLEDEAFIAEAALALWRASGDDAWLARARERVDAACARFLDPATGAFFDAAPGGGLFARVRSLDDGAMPSATGAILRALFALARAQRAPELARIAERAAAAVAPAVAEQPVSATGLLLALRQRGD